MVSFYKTSYHFSSLLAFNETLHEVSDLSQLWFRELHLGMTRGTRIQFPIDMSLPWMLIDHALEQKDASMIEYALYPFDLYNDSANFALSRFKKQFLYDEVEAEVDLCFDQFIYKLANKIFQYYKTLASSILLDKAFDNAVTREKVRIKKTNAKRFHVMFQQRHFQVSHRDFVGGVTAVCHVWLLWRPPRHPHAHLCVSFVVLLPVRTSCWDVQWTLIASSRRGSTVH